MSHLKRIAAPRTWITPRKGTKYLIRPLPGKQLKISMPLGIVLREMLRIAVKRKEVKELLNKGEVAVNSKTRKNDKFPVSIFDIISIPKLKKHYKSALTKNKRFFLEEISENEAQTKVCKVVNKTFLRGGKQQINLFNGRNLLSNEKVEINDSIVIDLEKGNVVKVLKLEKGAKSYIIGGRHLGEKGTIEEVLQQSARIKIKDKIFEIQLKNIYVTG